jgi:hypothetical protein
VGKSSPKMWATSVIFKKTIQSKHSPIRSIWDRCYDFFKYFRRKKLREKLAFLTQNKAKLCKIVIITLVSDKNANFFAENWQKSQKIVIITSTPGHPAAKFF